MMKKIITLLCFLISVQMQAQWAQVGGTVMDIGVPSDYINSDPIYQKLLFNPVTKELYAMSMDYTTTNGTPHRPTVARFDGTNWVTVGSAQFTPAEAEGLDMAIHPTTGEVYVSFYDNTGNGNGGVSVMRYDGNSWVMVGSRGFAEPQLGHFSTDPLEEGIINSYKVGYKTDIEFSQSTGDPYICFAIVDATGDGIAVMRYNSITPAWETVGSVQYNMTFEGQQSGVGEYTSGFAIDPDSGNPIIFARDLDLASTGSSVKMYDGSTWEYLGNSGPTIPYSAFISNRKIFFTDAGEIRITYYEGTSGIQHHVMGLVSGTWTEQYPAITGGNGVDFQLSDGVPYITKKLLYAPNDEAQLITERVETNGSKTLVGTYYVIRQFPNNGIAGQSSQYYLDRESMTFHPDDARPYVLSTEFTDDANKSITFIVYGVPDNSDPTVVNPIPDVALNEDESWSYQFPVNTFDDVDGNTLTYTATLSNDASLPTWLSFDGTTRTFTGTPLLANVGTTTVKVTADDGLLGVISDEFNIVVTEINDTPYITPSLGGVLTVSSGTQESAYLHTFSPKVFQDEEDGVLLNYSVSYPDDSPVDWLSVVPPNQAIQGTPKQADTGTITYKLTAEDSGGKSASILFDITIADVNIKPSVANAIPNQVGSAGEYFEFQVPANTFEDLDGDALTYSATLSAVGVWGTFDATTQTISGTPQASDIGTSNVSISAYDGGTEGFATANFQIQIVANNPPTVANPVPDQTTAEDAAFTFQFDATVFEDLDADVLTYSATLDDDSPLPGWLLFEQSNPREFTGTPTNEDVGIITIKVTADDSKGGVVSDNFDLEVINTNDAPEIINPIADQITDADVLYTFTFDANVFTDIDGDALTYTASKAPQGLVDDSSLPAWLTFNDVTRTLSGTPSASDIGIITVRITADDGNGGSATDEFDLEVYLNVAPVVDNPIPDQSANEDIAFNFTFAANTFSDANGNTLTYSATLSDDSSLPGWLGFDGSTRLFAGTATNDEVGLITIKVTADDGDGGSVSDEFDLTIINTNDAPTVVNSISNQTVTENEVFSFQFANNTFGDVDSGDQLTYSIGNTIPGWITFTSATRTFDGTPQSSDIGQFTVQVIAEDLSNETATTEFTVTVNQASYPPVVANPIANQDTDEDVSYNFTFPTNTFTDQNNDPLTYTATLGDNSALPSWLSFNGLTRTFSGTPLNDNVGTMTIRVIADDGNGNTATDNFDLIVNNINDTPVVINEIPNQTATEGQLFTFQFADNTFEDVDLNDQISYVISLPNPLPGWLTFTPETRTFQGIPQLGDVGVLTIHVGGQDLSNAISLAQFDITILEAPNNAPTVANPIANQTAAEDAAFSFQFADNTFTDIDGDPLAYSAGLTDDSSLPGWLSFTASSRTFSGTPVNSDVGVISVRVTAKDGDGATGFSDFNIEVTNTNDAPTVANSVPNQNAIEDALFNFQFAANTFSDVDASDQLTYSAEIEGGSALPAWLSFDAGTRTFSGTAANEDVGTFTIYIIADDGNGGSVDTFFDLVVSNTNDAPVVKNPIADQTATEGDAYLFQFAQNVFDDIDLGDNLSYSASLADDSSLPAWLIFEAAIRTFSGVPSSSDIGDLAIKITASDGSNASIFDEFVLTIAEKPLGLEDLSELITIYPNPVEKTIQLNLPESFSSKDISISIFTMNGVLVKELINTVGGASLISLDNMKSGAYLLRIESGGQTQTKRFIKD